jgi:aspartate racemase
MKTLGIIGGIAPESTIEYYRLLTAAGARSIVINSIDLDRMLSFVFAGDMPGLVEHLLPELDRLARAGAAVGLFASNTPHSTPFTRARRCR